MKPMLAATTDGTNIKYPVLVSPKLDGVRCLIIDGVAMSRSLKPIPNKFIQMLFGRSDLNGLDGELIVGPPENFDVYQRTVSGVMTSEGTPAVTFWVFDDFLAEGGFRQRLEQVERRTRKVGCAKLVQHVYLINGPALLTHESRFVCAGYEGIMIRDPLGPYKHGRSTLREGSLLKLKRFADSEARIVDCTQMFSNTNEAVMNELGQLERSSKKAGKVPMEMLGSFVVRDLVTDVQFEIGTGFTAMQREDFWKRRKSIVGSIVKYKSQPTGVKDKPRFPVFLGFRDARDL